MLKLKRYTQDNHLNISKLFKPLVFTSAVLSKANSRGIVFKHCLATEGEKGTHLLGKALLWSFEQASLLWKARRKWMSNNHQWLMTLGQECKRKATVAWIRAQEEWIMCRTDSAQHTMIGLHKHFCPVTAAFTLLTTLSISHWPQPRERTSAWVLKWSPQQV